MKLATTVSIVALLSQSATSFQPTTVPIRSFALNSLIDQAYDVPSISDTYSRAGSKVAEVAAAKVSTVVAPVAQSTAQTSAKVAEASVKVAEASSKIATEATAQVSSAVDEFVKAANDIAPVAKTTLADTASAFQPLVSPLTQYHFPRVEAHLEPLEPGKARPLFEYIQDALLQTGSISAGDYGASLEDAKSKLNLMISNTYAMFGKDAPSNLPELTSLPEGSAGWIATAAVSLIALGQRNAGLAEAKEAMGTIVQKEASAVSEIATELKNMGKEIEKLNKETAALSKELQAAQAKLTEKELAIGQERLAAADKELQLNRVINTLKTKLQEADIRLADLDELESIVSESPVSAPVEPTPLVTSVTESASIVDVVKEIDLGNSRKKKAAAKKTATKGAAKPLSGEKKAAAKKKSVKGATRKPAAKNAGATKKAASKKAKTAKKSDSDSWSALSPSTLSRKTVKQLTEYLSTKGVATTDADGKTLKKALLVEAVQAA